jgi:predicted dehydrogenase
MKQRTSRRNFVGGLSMAAMAMPGRSVLGANEKINLGFIGIGGRGGGHVGSFGGKKDVNVSYLCDADIKRAAGKAGKYPGAKSTTEMKQLLDSKDVDAVVVSTCNHWHVLASVWACQAGKDVYVEKPVSHNIWEGRKLVEAARKYDRIVQGGTQQRSDPMQAEIKAFLDSGKIGKMKWVRCNRYGVRGSIGKRSTPLKPPEEVNYDQWLGPAQDIPIMREKFHYDWHWDFNCGNGELGNWGPHLLDDLRNVAFRDKAAYPDMVVSGGGSLAWHDAGTSPNTHFTYMKVGDIPVIVDVHNLPLQKGVRGSDIYRHRKSRAFLIIECEGGRYEGGRGGGHAYDADGKKLKQFKGDAGRAHAQNWLNAVRSRKKETLNAEIEETHYSSAWCHLGNISCRLGKAYDEQQARKAVDFDGWDMVIDDFHNHVSKNEIDLSKESVRLGPMLHIDGEKETFTGSSATPEALALLGREYRKGFEVPDKV